jgi:hypothetical protein
MGKGNRIRAAKKKELLENHFKEMIRQNSVKRAFSLTPIARAVKVACRNWKA